MMPRVRFNADSDTFHLQIIRRLDVVRTMLGVSQ